MYYQTFEATEDSFYNIDKICNQETDKAEPTYDQNKTKQNKTCNCFDQTNAKTKTNFSPFDFDKTGIALPLAAKLLYD